VCERQANEIPLGAFIVEERQIENEKTQNSVTTLPSNVIVSEEKG
jgi:hypothetical protein